jgi:DedD protein
MAEAQDVETLKRRGRRRLVGAIALALVAVIVLPMVFDTEPRRSAPPVSVRVPGENEAPFKPKAAPKGEPAKPPPAKAPQPPAPEEKPEGRTQYMVPVGAFANPQNVIARLNEANLPHYTEPVATAKGTVMRVRVGPFPSKEAADRAAEKLKSLGFTPGSVSPRSG